MHSSFLYFPSLPSQVDGLNEDKLARHKAGNKSLGTTKKGIGPAYGSKIMRNGK